MKRQRRSLRVVAAPEGEPFEGVEHAWFWFMQARQAQADGAMLGAVEEAMASGQVPPEQLIEANRHLEYMSRLEIQRENQILAKVNATIRAEAASEDAYVRRWRPTFGYAVALSVLGINVAKRSQDKALAGKLAAGGGAGGEGGRSPVSPPCWRASRLKDYSAAAIIAFHTAIAVARSTLASRIAAVTITSPASRGTVTSRHEPSAATASRAILRFRLSFGSSYSGAAKAVALKV